MKNTLLVIKKSNTISPIQSLSYFLIGAGSLTFILIIGIMIYRSNRLGHKVKTEIFFRTIIFDILTVTIIPTILALFSENLSKRDLCLALFVSFSLLCLMIFTRFSIYNLENNFSKYIKTESTLPYFVIMLVAIIVIAVVMCFALFIIR